MPDFNQQQTDFPQLRSQILTDELLQIDKVQLERISPVALAYIGDAVYELYIRSRLLIPPKKIADYHNQVVSQVRAETQAIYLHSLKPYLTKEEKDILRRGRNAVTMKAKRMSAKTYRQASSLETLIGYLYLTNCDRLQDLLTKIELNYPLDG